MSREDDVASSVVCTDWIRIRGWREHCANADGSSSKRDHARGSLPTLIGENGATAGAVACGKRNGRRGSEEYAGAAHRSHAIGCDHPYANWVYRFAADWSCRV